MIDRRPLLNTDALTALATPASTALGRVIITRGECREAPGDLSGPVGIQVTERDKRAVGVVLGWHAAQNLARGGEAGERGIALVAKHYLSVLKTGIHQPEATGSRLNCKRVERIWRREQRRRPRIYGQNSMPIAAERNPSCIR